MDTMISPRILRAQAEKLACRPRHLTAKEEARQQNILDTAQTLLARNGAYRITFAALCIALRLSRATLQFHFVDMDDLLGALIRRHLDNLSAQLAAVTAPDPARQAALRRAAWRKITRLPDGSFTEAHTLLVQNLALLPEDLRQEFAPAYAALGAMLCPHDAHAALALLDAPDVTLEKAETALAALGAATPRPAPAHKAQPMPPPVRAPQGQYQAA